MCRRDIFPKLEKALKVRPTIAKLIPNNQGMVLPGEASLTQHRFFGDLDRVRFVNECCTKIKIVFVFSYCCLLKFVRRRFTKLVNLNILVRKKYFLWSLILQSGSFWVDWQPSPRVLTILSPENDSRSTTTITLCFIMGNGSSGLLILMWPFKI